MLQFRSTPCTLLGYSSNHKGYRCLSSDGRVYISRDVLFDEHSFPLHKTSSAASSNLNSSSLHTASSLIPLVASPAAPNISYNLDSGNTNSHSVSSVAENLQVTPHTPTSLQHPTPIS